MKGRIQTASLFATMWLEGARHSPPESMLREDSPVAVSRGCRNFCVGGHTIGPEGRRDVWRSGAS